jgi:hypothetical protein
LIREKGPLLRLICSQERKERMASHRIWLRIERRAGIW